MKIPAILIGIDGIIANFDESPKFDRELANSGFDTLVSL